MIDRCGRGGPYWAQSGDKIEDDSGGPSPMVGAQNGILKVIKSCCFFSLPGVLWLLFRYFRILDFFFIGTRE